MARFFVPRGNIEGSRGIVVGEELLHLRRVLRLAAGDAISIFDDTVSNRRHYVTLPLTLGLGAKGDVTAVKVGP